MPSAIDDIGVFHHEMGLINLCLKVNLKYMIPPNIILSNSRLSAYRLKSDKPFLRFYYFLITTLRTHCRLQVLYTLLQYSRLPTSLKYYKTLYASSLQNEKTVDYMFPLI